MAPHRTLRIAVVAFLPALLLAGCDQPPTRELQAAEAALQKARDAEAATYVPERLAEAESALAAARSKLAAKDYRGALSSANEAHEKARGAASAAGPAKTLARSAAETAMAEAQSVLDDVGTVRQEATDAKVPEEAFAEHAPREQELREGLEAVARQLAGGDILGAQKAALELKSKSIGLNDAFREARTKWDEEHPKGKPRKKR
jgi:hypothetical protein